MGSNSSLMLQRDEIAEIAKETGFNSKQIKRLYNRFLSLDKDGLGFLTKQSLLRIPELNVNPLRDRIVDVILDDHGQDGNINFKQFALLFSVFRRGHNESGTSSKENKLKFLFSIYDRDKDGKINKSELLAVLNMLIGYNLPEEQMNSMAERTIAEVVAEMEPGSSEITFKMFIDTLQKIDVEEKMSMKFLT